ncbi:MAG: hypothetical protein J6O50_01265 [Ruminiclostridium sp.]|nr:hypothetical protein [Ruminiclostridium sp.]
MAKDLGYTILFDIYAPLLTDKKRDTLDLYYNDDLSLTEIAEITGTTRQAVMNCIRSCERRLDELENEFGLHRKSRRAGELLDALSAHTDGSGTAADIISELRELI